MVGFIYPTTVFLCCSGFLLSKYLYGVVFSKDGHNDISHVFFSVILLAFLPPYKELKAIPPPHWVWKGSVTAVVDRTGRSDAGARLCFLPLGNHLPCKNYGFSENSFCKDCAKALEYKMLQRERERENEREQYTKENYSFRYVCCKIMLVFS